MNSNEKYQDLFDRYFRDELNIDELVAFELRLEEDIVFRDAFRSELALHTQLTELQNDKKVHNIQSSTSKTTTHQKSLSSTTRWLQIAAAFMLGILASWWWFHSNSTKPMLSQDPTLQNNNINIGTINSDTIFQRQIQIFNIAHFNTDTSYSFSDQYLKITGVFLDHQETPLYLFDENNKTLTFFGTSLVPISEEAIRFEHIKDLNSGESNYYFFIKAKRYHINKGKIEQTFTPDF